MAANPTTLVIACGALAREMLAVAEQQGLANLAVTCLPAVWHNRPEKIAGGVRAKIREAKGKYGRIFVAYGDCGTGGELDRVLAEEGVERIDGPHCYQFFAGAEAFAAMMAAEPGSFFLTDYLARHFERVMIEGLGLDKHPELRDDYFGNYRKLVYLAQTEDADLTRRAAAAAARIGLEFERRATGYGELAGFMRRAAGA
jgi:Protein of unknown function (DUF1638)